MQKPITVMISSKIILTYFLSITKKKVINMSFGKNWKTYHKTSNIVDFIGSIKMIHLIAIHLNKFKFDSKIKQA